MCTGRTPRDPSSSSCVRGTRSKEIIITVGRQMTPRQVEVTDHLRRGRRRAVIGGEQEARMKRPSGRTEDIQCEITTQCHTDVLSTSKLSIKSRVNSWRGTFLFHSATFGLSRRTWPHPLFGPCHSPIDCGLRVALRWSRAVGARQPRRLLQQETLSCRNQ